MYRGLHFCFAAAVVLAIAGCSHAGGFSPLPYAQQNSGAVPPAHENVQPGGIPDGWRCFPFQKPGGRPTDSPAIAYGGHCAVSNAPAKAKLQKLAVALLGATADGTYLSYCTGTPIRFNPATGVGFVATAAHCLVGYTRKPAGKSITPADIFTFRLRDASIYQGPIGKVSNNALLTGRVSAVYVPSRYCKGAVMDEGCLDLSKQNGDLGVLKIVVEKSKTLGVLPNFRVAPKSLVIGSAQNIMALGYGLNTTPTPGSKKLYYIDYQFFAKDAYRGVSSQASIMNGYYRQSNAMFYSIICKGDSGGGDFYWDGSRWNLIGTHSWGTSQCGGYNARYDAAFDVSADVRPFTPWINKILSTDKARTGCASLGAAYVCAAR
ncbi:MAG: trypsin-like serine protease [Candidatus Cybelea sp.]|jgi:Trypsin